jgi:hypothetical protein
MNRARLYHGRCDAAPLLAAREPRFIHRPR